MKNKAILRIVFIILSLEAMENASHFDYDILHPTGANFTFITQNEPNERILEQVKIR